MDQKEYSEIKALLAQLNERIDALYQDKPAFELIVPAQTETETETEPEYIPGIEPEPEPQPIPAPVSVPEPIHKPIPEPAPERIPEPAPERIPEPAPRPAREPVRAVKPKTAPTIGDLFTNMNPGPTVADVLARDNSRKALRERISFNDKYLFTKVLFNQDAGLFNNTLDILEPMTSMREVESYLGEHFPNWDVTSTAVHRFLCQMEDHVR